MHPSHTDPHRWWALVAVAVAQLMLAADGTIMNIALPSAAAELGLSPLSQQWTVTIYLLGYGGLLLLGGRVSDVIGRRRALLVGLGGVAAASVLGGLAGSGWMLLTARGLQGVFGALMTPAALGILSTTFPAGPERRRAYGIYATIMGSGTGIGVLLGGVLTGGLSWRWALWVNLPIAAVSGLIALRAIRAGGASPSGGTDVSGAALGTSGLAALVLGLSFIESPGLGSPVTVALLGAGLVLLVLFVRQEARTPSPLLPLRILRHRPRLGAYLAMLSWGVLILAAFLFLSFGLQNVLGYSPLSTGLAFLPYPLAIQIGVRVVARLPGRVPTRAVLAGGLGLIAAGMGALALLHPGSTYLTGILPVFLLLGLGTSCVLPAANSTATVDAGPDTGVAAATAMTAQQIGGSLGTAVLGAVATAVTTSALGTSTAAAAALHGYSTAALIGAGFALVAAVAVHRISGRDPRTIPSQGAPR